MFKKILTFYHCIYVVCVQIAKTLARLRGCAALSENVDRLYGGHIVKLRSRWGCRRNLCDFTDTAQASRGDLSVAARGLYDFLRAYNQFWAQNTI